MKKSKLSVQTTLQQSAALLGGAVVLLLCCAAPTSAFYLPDSDQRKCYEAVSPYAEIPCEGTGQDGEYIINPLSYTDNGDGTVTDSNTGLVWQQQDDGNLYNWYQASGTYDATYNPDSIDVCGSLDLGGATDWRLPTKKELTSIVDYGVPVGELTISTAYFLNAKGSHYHSSTAFAVGSEGVWHVRFNVGFVNYDNKVDGRYVRCVRGIQAEAVERLADNGNGTVTDNNTSLIWQQSESEAMSWGSALRYCDALDLGGNSDWRLPHIKELESLVDDSRIDPAIDTKKFPGAHSAYYLSSTTFAPLLNVAWIVDFFFGYVDFDDKDYHDIYVRCVRGGQSRALDNSLVTLNVTQPNVAENSLALGRFFVTRTEPKASDLTVYYSVTGTATAGIDYEALAGSVTILAGQTQAEIVVTPIDDALVEGDETVVLTIDADAAYDISTPSSATVTIASDDVNVPPTLGSLTPSQVTSTPGTPRAFTAVYSDANGYMDINLAYLLVNPTTSVINGIYVFYRRATGKIALYNDAGNAQVGSCIPGAPGVLANTQGSIDCAATTVSGSGNNLTIAWSITPATASTTKTKNIYLAARDASNVSTGWADKGDWTIFVNHAPTVGPLIPSVLSSAPGVAQTFTATYSDANGSADLSLAYLLVNQASTVANGIYAFYSAATGKIALYDDAATTPVGSCTPGAVGSLANSQGSIDCAATTVSISGNNLTIAWRVTPTGAFAASAKNIYLSARDASDVSTGLVDLGDWSFAVNVAPTLGTLTPSILTSGAGVPQSLTAVYSDANGHADLILAYLLVNPTTNVANAIYAFYNRTTGKIALYNDAGTAQVGSCTPGTAGVLANTQGSIDCVATTVSGAGNDLTIVWNVTPSASFAATTKNIYLSARDGSAVSTGWVDKGDWSVAVNYAPTLGTVTPAVLTSGPGSAQTLTAVYSDANGYADLNLGYLLVNSTTNITNGIYAYYNRAAGKISLYDDAGTARVGSCTPGLPGVLSNTQGSIDCTATTVSGSGSNLTIAWSVTPSGAFASRTTKNVYLSARDSSSASVGWGDRGDWTIFTNAAPTLGGVTPPSLTSAPGVPQTLTAVYSDANGAADINLVYLLVNPTASVVNGIYAFYNRSTGKIALYNDAGTTQVGSCTPGTAGSLSNTSGSIDCAATSVTGSGNDLTIAWRITPFAAFASPTKKNVHLSARDASNVSTGWGDRGDWTIN